VFKDFLKSLNTETKINRNTEKQKYDFKDFIKVVKKYFSFYGNAENLEYRFKEIQIYGNTENRFSRTGFIY